MGLDNSGLAAGLAAAALAAAAGGCFSTATRPKNPMLLLAGLAALAAVVATAAGRRGRQALRDTAFLNYPRQYLAPRGTVPTIDGDVFKSVWDRAPWSEAFMEIRGQKGDAPPGSGPSEAQATKMKMLWDDDFLYIAAVIDLAEGDELVAKFKERNSPIFHTDSDFEVFLDPSGCCHGYKELEMNALNTVWNLMLDRPYSDGGTEFGGRVAKEGEPLYWEVQSQKTAVRITKGSLSNPAQPSQWCCEIALAHTDSLSKLPRAGPRPAEGAFWRINFSRVEKGGAVNWVWSPQIVWTPKESRYAGQVNMHLPDAWGYVVFADEAGSLPGLANSEDFRDPAWPARHVAACVYYACHAFREASGGRAPASMAELLAHEGGALLRGAELGDALVSISAGEETNSFTIEVTAAGHTVQIDNQRLLTVV